MCGSVAHAWIWSVPPPPTTRKSRCAIEEHTWRACAGVYSSSWNSTLTVRLQTVWPGCFQNVAAPAWNELFGNGVPVPVSGACRPMLIVDAVTPVVLPPCGVPHAVLPPVAVVPVDVVPVVPPPAVDAPALVPPEVVVPVAPAALTAPGAAAEPVPPP